MANSYQGFSAASTDLGLGANLGQQVADETEEEKKRRRLGLSPLQSPAAQMLLGGMGGVAGGRGF